MDGPELAYPRPELAATVLWEIRQGTAAIPRLDHVGTGFEPLDNMLEGGFLPGELVVLGARAGAGKTSLALQWANAVSRSGRRATFACFGHDEYSLTTRLVLQAVASTREVSDPTERHRLRRMVYALLRGHVSYQTAVAEFAGINEIMDDLASFSTGLQLFRPWAQRTTPEVLLEACGSHLQVGSVLFVDYLQKVSTSSDVPVEQQIFRVTEMLKELAVSRQITVVAVSAAHNDRINRGAVRLADLQGSDAIASECDVALVLNDKANLLASRQGGLGASRNERDRQLSVLTIEKNRRGEVGMHMEFTKDLSNFRFEPRGAFVGEPID